MVQCSFIIPEKTYPTHSEMVEQEDGSESKKITHYKTDPAHQCEAEATGIERDLEEVDIPGIQGVSHKILDDRPGCNGHTIGGTIKNLNGSVGRTAIMSIMDDSGIRA